MKHLKHSIILAILILLQTVNSSAKDTLVFEDITYLTTELQQCQILKEENIVLLNQINTYSFDINILEQTISTIEAQNVILQKENENQKKYLETMNSFIIKYDGLLTEQKKMYELIIKESKPSFWTKAKNAVGLIGIGIILGVGVILL